MDAITFGTDGWRSRYDTAFTEYNVARVADAAARVFVDMNPQGTVYVGYDTRRDGHSYAHLVASTVAGYGLRVVLSDSYCPTSAMCWNVAHDESSVGGLMLTASHNSAGYNGLKVRVSDGGAAPKAVTDLIERSITAADPHEGASYETADFISPYLAMLKREVDTGAIASAQLKVVHDALYGATAPAAANLLRGMGVDVIECNATQRDDFGGLVPDPVEPWISTCCDLTRKYRADIGLVNDGDGDRIGAVDETGTPVTSHKIIALLIGHLVENRGLHGRVVGTTSCSALVRRQAARLGCPLTVSPIGFKWVYTEMLKGDVLIGGEEYGGIGIPLHLLERDGLYSGLLLLELMAQSGMSLSQLVANLESKVGAMEYARRDIVVDAFTLQMLRNVLPGLNPQTVAGMKPVEVSHIDGMRLGFADDSWLLVRVSDTEPLARVYAEAPTAEQRDALLDEGCALVEGDF